ncbi:hypothetical protein ACWD4T_08595, partial [Streptomyces umbrinus]
MVSRPFRHPHRHGRRRCRARPAASRPSYGGSGQLLAAGNGDWGFTAFAIAGLSSMVFIGIASLRTSRQSLRSDPEKSLSPTG